ncbi:hypothetical protein LTR64_004241 [Lithohypha guttulata]|uniref:Uncharacterized protein n=1 Tax=Lithohypha guttulata TaxID=1690604 RepID=A0AAN7T302_9EURO|nr:hypothetical protein LTR51_006463 [Lithohypha guttulata]KAK5088672.1 hypothetical protein LTR05_002892 [Lithohypha guttulata]
MPFVPASPTRLFSRRQSLGKMQKLRKLNSKRDSQTKVNKTPEAVLNDPLLSGSLSQHDLITTKLSQDSTSPAKEASGSSTDSSTQQDIFAALADTAAFTEAASVSGKEDQASLETATEPEHLFEEDTAPIIGRASSVRASKPQIVQHKHTKKARLQVKNMDSIDETDDQGGPSARIPREEDATVDRRSSAVSQSAISASSKDTTANSASDKGPSEFEPVPAHTPGLPTGGTVHSIHPSIVDADIPTVSSSNQDHNETAPVPAINRTMSSPLPLPGKGLSRRVTIRPADLIIKNHDRDGPSTFRESVVTTPYPARMNSDASSLDFDAEKKQNEMKAPTSRAGRDKARRGVSFTAAPGSKDRFPSPERPEVLFIDLNLSRHPCARTTIEIQIAGKSTFDDEMLFNQIRAAYTKQLLGSTRLLFLLVRRLGYVSVTVPTNYDASEFNGVDFMRNLSNPNYGHKRKAWVIWLRKNNPQSASRLSSSLMHPAPVRQIDNLNRLSSLRTRSLGHSRQGSRNRTDSTDCNEENKRFRTISDASSFHFVYSPAMPRLPFLSSKDNSEPQPIDGF